MWSAIIGLASNALGYIFPSQEVRAKRAEMKNQIELAKIERDKEQFMSNLNAVSDYDNQAMRNKDKSIMDEIIAFIHLIPIWLPALDSLKEYKFTEAGNAIMTNLVTAPAEWWFIYLGIVSSTFGLRWMAGRQEINKMLKGIEERKLILEEKKIDEGKVKDKDKEGKDGENG